MSALKLALSRLHALMGRASAQDALAIALEAVKQTESRMNGPLVDLDAQKWVRAARLNLEAASHRMDRKR